MSLDRKYPLPADPRMKSILEALYNAIDELQRRPTTVAISPTDRLAIAQQAAIQAAGLLGPFGVPVLGQTGDPLLTNIGTGNGTVSSFSSGDLSPLFTTLEATPTTTPALSFAQIVQNANLIFAGPVSGLAANPAFRSLAAVDIQAISITLLSSTTMNLNTNTKQSLYTVPAGKSVVPLFIVARSASVDLSTGITTSLSFGFNAGANDWANATLGTALLTSSTLFLVLSQELALGGGASKLGTAGQVFGAITNASFGSAATVVIDTYGYPF